MPSMTTVTCKKCKCKFQARTADVKRGWGRFCSKSCKASEQTFRTGRGKPGPYREPDYEESDVGRWED